MSILDLIRPELLMGNNYAPGGENAKHRLHTNELPYSPTQFEDLPLNVYPPESLQANLTQQLAHRYQVAENQLVLTRGSDDGIDLLVRLFLTAGKDALMQFPPTFPLYAFYVHLQQGELIQCPLDEQFTVDLQQVAQCWQPNCKIIMVCNPNNPTGSIFNLDFIASLCDHYANRSMIIVDEAYIEFANMQSATSLINQFDNLVVLRTLSKAYGLAGLRIGAILAQDIVINALKKIMAPYMISSAAMLLAQRSLAKQNWPQLAITRIEQAKQQLITRLLVNPLIEKVYPTSTNFILLKTSYTKSILDLLKNNGVAVRDFPVNSRLANHLRITVGTEEQNQLIIDAFLACANELI